MPMTRTLARRAGGFSLVELPVVIAILGVLLGLLVSAIQVMRENAARTECQNNLKRIGQALHNCHDVHKRFPPGVGWFPGERAYGIVSFHLLPYLEQKNLYQQADGGGYLDALNNGVYARGVPVYVCPADPSVRADGTVLDLGGLTWGAGCYAGNAQVFDKVDRDGRLLGSDGRTRLADITDGTSSTILYAEKYARCTGPVWPEGGSLWAYAETLRPQPLHAGFALSWTLYSIGPDSRFQHQPLPDNCDPTLTATAHRGGMPVCMADGSVHVLAPTISGETWWALCTPRSGDIPGDDWQ
jgi:type II secretory pathway pseudopilin PulG